MKSFMQKKESVSRDWYVIDAADVPLGRLAVMAATMLRGKHKPTYTPYVDCGDNVIIINAKDVLLTVQIPTLYVKLYALNIEQSDPLTSIL